MTEEEARKFICDYINHHNNRAFLKTLLKRNNILFYVDNWQKDKLIDYPFGHKLYWFINEIKDFPKCKICGKEIKSKVRSYGEYKSTFEKKDRYCSISCAQKDPDVINKSVSKWKMTIQNRNCEFSEINEDDVRSYIINYLGTHSNRSMLKSILIKKNYYKYIDSWEYEKLKNYTFGHRLYWFVHKIHDFPKCKICGKNVLSCARGYEEYKLMMKDYCSRSCLHRDKEIQEKLKSSCYKHYGCFWPMQSYEIRERSISSYLANHGGDHPAHCLDIKKKMQDGLRNTYRGRIYEKIQKMEESIPLFTKEFFVNNGLLYNDYKWKCKKCKNEFYQRIRYIDKKFIVLCPSCYNIRVGRSYQEGKIFELVKDSVYQCCEVISNCKSQIKNDNGNWMELDVYVPYLKLAFEYNGDYWHSEKFVGKYYHENKTKLCQDKGIKLIHIWEHDWISNKDTMISAIKQIINDREKEILKGSFL